MKIYVFKFNIGMLGMICLIFVNMNVKDAVPNAWCKCLDLFNMLDFGCSICPLTPVIESALYLLAPCFCVVGSAVFVKVQPCLARGGRNIPRISPSWFACGKKAAINVSYILRDT